MNAVVLALALTALSADAPDLLRGVDSLPAADAVAAASGAGLVDVVTDRRQGASRRARAARLLGLVDVDDAAIDAALRGIVGDRLTPAAVRAQVTIGLAERAARRGEQAAVLALADAALADDDVAVARAGVLVWWSWGGEVARARLTALAARPDTVGGAARGRLREFARAGWWRRLDGDAVGGAVLDHLNDGPPPAR